MFHPFLQLSTLAFALLTFTSLQAQTKAEWAPESYSRQAAEAAQQLGAGNYPEAARLYRAAIAAWNGKASVNDWLGAARAYSFTGDRESALLALNKLCASKGYFDHEAIQQDTAFHTWREDPRFRAAVACIRDLQEKLAPRYNADWSRRITRMCAADQAIRQMVQQAREKNSRQDVVDRLLEEQNELDKVNGAAVDRFLSQYGWPDRFLVDFSAGQDLMTLLIHAPLPIKLKHVELVKQAVKDNKIPGATFAVFFDKMSVFQTGMQRYGTQIITWQGVTQLFPIEDEANVNQRRKEIGLEPIEAYVRHFGITYLYEPGKPRPELPKIDHK